ncbi:Cation channel sperm-associated protein 1, partial [Dictyocoela muelleri]
INHFLKVLRVLRVLRSFRALRVLRTIRFIQPIHTIVKTCFKALPAMASIAFIMIIITCISAIIARSLFGDLCPSKFSNLVKTFFSLFVLLTLDDWYSIYQECEDNEYASFQLMFCLIYIFIINFILLNLLMAVLGE